jgi:glutamate-1-semialdehyde 2,1-aminomutase
MIENWERSKALLARARQSLAGGVSSPFRAKAPVPLYFEDGCGPRLRDVDGNEYIDYQLAWGPMILGYRHPKLVEAMLRQANLPFSYGAQHELEISVAEKIQRIVPCAERVAFTSSGSEAVQLAQRLARAHTKRNLILKFEGHYHGWMDSALVSYHPAAGEVGPLETPHAIPGSAGQVPNTILNTAVAVWNRLDLLEHTLKAKGDRVAAVFMEPVLCNSGCLLPSSGYLEGARDLCRQYGALLVFDEVITGFRMALGGAQAHYGVTPDLATFGKAVAGGAALSVIAGRREIMEQMYTSGVSFGGTFNGNPLSLAAAEATLDELARNDGHALAEANRIGAALMEGIRAIVKRNGAAVTLTGFGTAFALHFTSRRTLSHYRDTFDDDGKRLRKFLLRALERGLYIVPDGRFYTSAVHTARELDETLSIVSRIFALRDA